MITYSIAHVLQSVLQYIVLIAALLLYCWIKDVSTFLGSTHITKIFDRRHHILKSRHTCPCIHDEPSMLYQWIRRLRRERNLTQEELAEKIGVDPRTVQRWEQGARPQPRHYSMFQRIEQESKWRDRRNRRYAYYDDYGDYDDYDSTVHYRRLSLGWLGWLLLLLIALALLVFLILRFWLHII